MLNNGQFKKGHKPWTAGIHHSEETKRKISDGNKGKVLPREAREKISKALKGEVSRKRQNKLWANPKYRKHMSEVHKGYKYSLSLRKKRSEAHKGNKSHFWKGGLTEKSQIIRGSYEYKLWREAVFTRDNYTCIWCGQRGGRLNADHIKPFALYPELRFAIDNGRTLCHECHKKTYTYGKNIQV